MRSATIYQVEVFILCNALLNWWRRSKFRGKRLTGKLPAWSPVSPFGCSAQWITCLDWCSPRSRAAPQGGSCHGAKNPGARTDITKGGVCRLLESTSAPQPSAQSRRSGSRPAASGLRRVSPRPESPARGRPRLWRRRADARAGGPLKAPPPSGDISAAPRGWGSGSTSAPPRPDPAAPHLRAGAIGSAEPGRPARCGTRSADPSGACGPRCLRTRAEPAVPGACGPRSARTRAVPVVPGARGPERCLRSPERADRA
nr:uncharacterized protein LOC109729237 [Microcebus murinus]